MLVTGRGESKSGGVGSSFGAAGLTIPKNNRMPWICNELECKKQPYYAAPGVKKPQYCFLHKKIGHVDVRNKRSVKPVINQSAEHVFFYLCVLPILGFFWCWGCFSATHTANTSQYNVLSYTM